MFMINYVDFGTTLTVVSLICLMVALYTI